MFWASVRTETRSYWQQLSANAFIYCSAENMYFLFSVFPLVATNFLLVETLFVPVAFTRRDHVSFALSEKLAHYAGKNETTSVLSI